MRKENSKMKLTKNILLSVSMLVFVCFGFISSTFAVQPGWTKKQVIKELGKPDNVVNNSTFGETWTYNATPKKKSFFGSIAGSKLLLNVVDVVTPKPSGTAAIGYKISRGAITASAATNKKRGSALKSKEPDTASAMVIHFDADGRVVEPGMYHGTPDTSTVQTQIISSEPPQIIRDEGRLAKYKENVVIESMPVVVKEPKHVYVDNEDVCHRPYCKNIIGIEKQTMQRFATLEQALQDENKKCDSCMTSEETK